MTLANPNFTEPVGFEGGFWAIPKLPEAPDGPGRRERGERLANPPEEKAAGKGSGRGIAPLPPRGRRVLGINPWEKREEKDWG